ncbi:Acetyl-CoA-benzylalcohol acetyltransferase [Vitis vinifera]|uniref:Acetyl-CoA-benzylalcohol acetyltransferase n=1 Tax=Vitis vinifera TaxID=29760 RepID=A0A438GC78_VITVI|nr:Acetyl-CoA-benzylalcohol acetyltransferase [Vitis vinifera]
MEVQILSRKMIKPSSPTPPHLRNLMLSPIDQGAPHTYVPTLFYYPISGSNGSSRGENIERRKRLETSLSDTLTLFYPLAGRLIKDSHAVDCNDEGIEFLDAKVDGQLKELLSRRNDVIGLLNSFTQFDSGSSGSVTAPLVVIQTTMFDCGGLAIGISIRHAIADGFTMVHFVTAWATANRAGINQLTRPDFNLASLFPAKDLPVVKPDPPPRILGFDKVVTKRFLFDGAKISILAAKYMASDQGVRWKPSRVEVVTSLIRGALIRVSLEKHGRLRNSVVIHSVNLRGKIIPAIPDFCCGNLYRRVIARFMVGRSKWELSDLVSLLRDALSQEAVYRKDVLQTVIRSSSEVHEDLGKEETNVYFFSSWCRTRHVIMELKHGL